MIERSSRNTAITFILGLGAGAVAIAISLLIRSFAGGPFIPELASQTLFSLTPGQFESQAVENLGPLAKYSAFSGAVIINFILYGLFAILLTKLENKFHWKGYVGRAILSSLVAYVMDRLEATKGDPAVRYWFEKTMNDGPDESDKSMFTRLDRFVMELFRTISPNAGSDSSLSAIQQPFGTAHPGFSTIVTLHSAANRDPLNWRNPNEFDPERYKKATTSEQNDEAKAKQVGLTQSPFSKEDFQAKDGRHVAITNSAFGAVYPHVNDKAHPVCDAAGYAPFGFGYRRCAGEFLTVGFFKDLLRKVWSKKIAFIRLNIEHPELLPVGPHTVVPDNIGFKRTR